MERAVRMRRAEAAERVQQEGRSLHRVASAEIEHERTSWRRARRAFVALRRGRFHASARHHAFSPHRRSEQAFRQPRFSFRDEEHSSGGVEDALHLREIRIGFVVQQRLQHGPASGERDSQERRAVEIRRKDDAVVSVALSLDVLEETWRADALFDEGPRHRRRNGRRSLCLGNLVELQ